MHKKFRVEKLIRDNMPEILRERDIALEWHTLDSVAYANALSNKLIEEAHEVATAPKDELLEEISDVQEVIDALLKCHGFTHEQLKEAQAKKKGIRGGFDRKVYATTMEMDEKSPYIDYYLSKPDEYPETF